MASSLAELPADNITCAMGTAKDEFLKEFGADYGYPHGPKSVDEIRATEFRRLDGLVYLDHAGATLYSELQMDSIFKDLTANVYGNPHSQSDSSTATSDVVKEARQQVLDYCKASPKDYKCIFTSGATAALKLVGEAFPWSHQSSFMYTTENHNSVLGIREYALNQGGQAFAVDIEDLDLGASKGPFAPLSISSLQIQKRNEATQKKPPGDTYNLFAFPSECNFSGLKFSLKLVKLVKGYYGRMFDDPSFCNGHWMVLVDAAKGCATKPPDLSEYPADFVVVSFYKLFGYPTGLGALIVHKDAARLLKKTYFSGGTVAASISDIDYVKRREGIEELFEDGTTSFLSIASIRYGFKVLNALTTRAIFWHTTSLTRFVRKSLLAMRHGNGSRVCILYGSCTPKVFCNELGPIVSFNLKRPDGSWFGHREVEKLASLSAIQLRTGCFCNPGACAKYLGLSHSDLLSNIEAGHVCWDDCDVIHGKPTGAVRVSFGYMSTYEDAKKFIDFVAKSFVCRPKQSGHECQVTAMSVPHPDEDLDRRLPSGYLKSITIYPVKSCAGFSIDKWPLSGKGLRYDREWVLQSLNGEILTQKKVPGMGLVGTFIDLNEGILIVESPCCKERLQINLNSKSYNGGIEEINLYGRRYEVQGYNNEVNAWFSTAIGRQCTLLRYLSSSDYVCLDSSRQARKCRDSQSLLHFANEAQMLLISEESVADLNKRLRTNGCKGIPTEQIQVNPMRFRPNLVISGGRPYAEDGWRSIKVGNKYFSSVGGCNRCQMINFSIESGLVLKSNEPLATLATYRRDKGQILFGLLLKYEPNNDSGQDDDSQLQVGEEIHSNTV